MTQLNPITISVGDTYTEKPYTKTGFTTYVNGSVDTSTPGDYTIDYTLIKLSPFETESHTLTVSVVGVSAKLPEIRLKGQADSVNSAIHNILLDRDGDYSEMDEYLPENALGAEALNGEPVTLIGELRPYIEGSYTLIYTATNNFGTAIATRTLHIKSDIQAPAFGLDLLNTSIFAPESGVDATSSQILPPESGIDFTGLGIVKPGSGIDIVAGFVLAPESGLELSSAVQTLGGAEPSEETLDPDDAAFVALNTSEEDVETVSVLAPEDIRYGCVEETAVPSSFLCSGYTASFNVGTLTMDLDRKIPGVMFETVLVPGDNPYWGWGCPDGQATCSADELISWYGRTYQFDNHPYCAGPDGSAIDATSSADCSLAGGSWSENPPRWEGYFDAPLRYWKYEEVIDENTVRYSLDKDRTNYMVGATAPAGSVVSQTDGSSYFIGTYGTHRIDNAIGWQTYQGGAIGATGRYPISWTPVTAELREYWLNNAASVIPNETVLNNKTHLQELTDRLPPVGSRIALMWYPWHNRNIDVSSIVSSESCTFPTPDSTNTLTACSFQIRTRGYVELFDNNSSNQAGYDGTDYKIDARNYDDTTTPTVPTGGVPSILYENTIGEGDLGGDSSVTDKWTLVEDQLSNGIIRYERNVLNSPNLIRDIRYDCDAELDVFEGVHGKYYLDGFWYNDTQFASVTATANTGTAVHSRINTHAESGNFNTSAWENGQTHCFLAYPYMSTAFIPLPANFPTSSCPINNMYDISPVSGGITSISGLTNEAPSVLYEVIDGPYLAATSCDARWGRRVFSWRKATTQNESSKIKYVRVTNTHFGWRVAYFEYSQKYGTVVFSGSHTHALPGGSMYDIEQTFRFGATGFLSLTDPTA